MRTPRKPERAPRRAGDEPHAVRLEWPSRSWHPGQRSPRSAVAAKPIERVGDGAHRLIAGDALEVCDALVAQGLSGKVDLVYVDPPFFSGADYVHETRIDGPADGRVSRTLAYEDRWASASGLGDYLDHLGARLEALAGLLSPRGTLWVHLDWRAAYLVRVLLDEIFGRERFINEIVWRRAPNLGRQAASHQFGRTLDTLLVCGGPHAQLRPPTRLETIDPNSVRTDDEGRAFTTAPRGDYTDQSVARLEAEGRIHRSASGRVYVKYFLVKNDDGAFCRERRVDTLWTDVPPLRHARPEERTGFPTQKPRALLDRVVACATRPGGVVVDLFAGSGTTAEAAHALARRAIVGDASGVSLTQARARLLRAGAGLIVERIADCWAPSGAPKLRVDGSMQATRIVLVSPNEPVAWCVGRRTDDGALTTLWHSERMPGKRPTPVLREAILDGPASTLVARVFCDDGAMLETALVDAPDSKGTQ